MACRNPGCPRPMGSGSAKGLCPRCYRHSRRHGGSLPSPDVRVANPMRIHPSWRIADYVLDLVRQAAAMEGKRESEWAEEALLHALPLDRMAE